MAGITSMWTGKWTGTYEECSKTAKYQIDRQVRNKVWDRGHFPRVVIRNKEELKEEITKVFMAWYIENKKTYRVN